MASLSFLVRPTSATLWAVVALYYLIAIPGTTKKLHFLLLEVLPIGYIDCVRDLTSLSVFSLVVLVVVDYYFYGKWILTPYNFVMFNVIHDVGTFYGTHPWHWYLIPKYNPFKVLYCWFHCDAWHIASLCDWWHYHIQAVCLGFSHFMEQCSVQFSKSQGIQVKRTYSDQPLRFVLPVLPLAMIYAGYYLHYLWVRFTQFEYKVYKWTVITLLLINVPMAAYLSIVHQRAPMDLIHFISVKNCFY